MKLAKALKYYISFSMNTYANNYKITYKSTLVDMCLYRKRARIWKLKRKNTLGKVSINALKNFVLFTFLD